jgi:DNA-binding CsgD family transcriptional regulator
MGQRQWPRSSSREPRAFVLIFEGNCSILSYETGEGKYNQGDNMLTLKAVLRDRRIYFPDRLPPSGEHKILVTFLDEGAGNDVISKDQLNCLIACVVDQKAILNERQTGILELASKGMKSKQIADELHMTFGSVRNQLSRIYRKLEVKNRAEAISKGIEIGLINHGG